jgi:hypothetical protein
MNFQLKWGGLMTKKIVFFAFLLILTFVSTNAIYAQSNNGIIVGNWENETNFQLTRRNPSFSLSETNFEHAVSVVHANQLQMSVVEVSWLYNSLGFKQFMLMEGDVPGYYIYDLNSQQMLEYNTECYSDWTIMGKVNEYKMYAGPGSYYYVNNGKMVNIINQDILFEDLNILYSVSDTETVYLALNSTNLDFVISNQNFIDNYYYFKNLNLASEGGSAFNLNGTCGYVAVTMLLSYMDTFVNNDFIQDTIVYNNQNYTTGEDGNSNTTVDIKEWGVAPNTTAPRPNIELHDYLVSLGSDLGMTSGTGPNDWAELIVGHFNANPVSYSGISSSWLYLLENPVINQIDNNNPVIIGMAGLEYEFIDEYGNIQYCNETIAYAHAVIVYGYVKTDDGYYYNAHIGYSGVGRGNLIINPTLFGGYAYMNYDNTAHVCSNEYVYLTPSGVPINICPTEGISNYFGYSYTSLDLDYFISYQTSEILIYGHSHKHNIVVSENSNEHILMCEYCLMNSTVTEEHQYVIYNYDSINQHIKKCIVCDHEELEDHSNTYISHDSDIHTVYCIICRETWNETHNYDVYSLNETFHIYICDCGYSYTYYHNFDYIGGWFICRVCGYRTRDIVIQQSVLDDWS